MSHSPEPITPEFVNNTADLAETVETRTAQIEAYLEAENIDALWTRFVGEAEREAGTQATRFHNRRHGQSRVSYTAAVSHHAVTFEGTDPDGDYHYYEIPLGFLFPETRDQAKDAFRAHLRQVAEKERGVARRTREAEHAQMRAEIARLEAELATEDIS